METELQRSFPFMVIDLFCCMHGRSFTYTFETAVYTLDCYLQLQKTVGIKFQPWLSTMF